MLARTIEKLGGKLCGGQGEVRLPGGATEVAARCAALCRQAGAGAVSAYLGAVLLFDNRELSKAAASILGDEAMHWAVLRQAIGETPVPSAFMS